MSTISNNFVFPKNPFEDVKPSDFNKLNKKEVTEDFVGENFRSLGWDVYKPFTDTGIDRIIVKTVCSDGHTPLDENLKYKKNCSQCEAEPIEIYRFIQVKTRSLKDGIFGFTLKPKDIRVDPRHVFLLYSDKTTENQQDFLIVPIKKLLEFFKNANINPFSSKSFRTGNNKLNSLKYDPMSNKWTWNGMDWEDFRNINGLKILQNPDIDLNLKNEIISTRNLANELQYSFSGGRSYSKITENLVNNVLNEKRNSSGNKSKILETRKKVDNFIENHCNEDTKKSSRKYFENIKLADTIGDANDSGGREDE